MSEDQRTKSDRQNANIDRKILEMVAVTREEFQACTLSHVASQMRMSQTAIRARMARMKGVDLDWNKIQGSVHLLPAGLERIGRTVGAEERAPDPETVTPAPGVDEDVIARAVAAATQAAIAAIANTPPSPDNAALAEFMDGEGD